MEQQRLAQQFFGFYKVTHENTISSIESLKDHTKKLTELSLCQSPWLPQQTRDLVNMWVNAYVSGLDKIKAAADAQYRKYKTAFNPDQPER